MINILKYLFTIRFRKIFAKDDFFAMVLFVVTITAFAFFFQLNYSKYVNYLPLYLFEIIAIQTNRSDKKFLLLNADFRVILFLEYLILSLPILVLLLINQRFLFTIGYLLITYLVTFINKTSVKTQRYPFKMFDVFWTITFRKYKLFWLMPFLIFLIFMGHEYQNQNLEHAVLLLVAIILSAPTSEREKIYFIKTSAFVGKQYLWQQIKTIGYNSIFFIIPIAICFAVLQEFKMVLIVPFLVLMPITNLLFKYVYLDRIIVHNIFFAMFLGFMMYGFPLLFIPILYLKSIKNLNSIQNA